MSTERHLAVTLHQPWASWIWAGWKPIESRTHDKFKRVVGQSLWIHAGQKWDNNAMRTAEPYLTKEQLRMTMDQFYDVRGRMLCRVKVKDHQPLHEEDSAGALFTIDPNKRYLYGLFLELEKVLRPAPAVKGAQGLWYWEPPNTTLVKLCDPNA